MSGTSEEEISRIARLFSKESPISVFKEIAPLQEPTCDTDHHERKRETITEAFDIVELAKILVNEKIAFTEREQDLCLLNMFYVRRAMVRVINSRYFDDINLIAPVYDKVRHQERQLAEMQTQLRQQEERLQKLEQAATK